MPQRKKRRPLTTGKGTYSKPIATPGRSPRRVSSKPSAAGKVRSAKKTTSSGITRTPSGRRQSEGRSARQATGKARVTSSKPTLKYQARNRKITEAGEGQTGLRKYSGRAKVTTGRGRSGPKLPKLPAKSSKVTRGGGTGRAAMPKESAARKAARAANRVAKGYGRKAAGAGALRLMGRVAAPLAAGLAVGKMMQKLPKNVSTSGRGAGRAAFKPKKKKR